MWNLCPRTCHRLGLILTTMLLAVLLHGAIPSWADDVSYPPDVDQSALRDLISSSELTRPRLLLTPADIPLLRDRVEKDAAFAAVARSVLADADAMLKTEPIERIQQGRRLLGESRRAVRRLLTLGMAWHLTERQAYADRAAEEMKAIAAFSDWNPSHFLDVAEMTFAMAIGYDWMYAALDPSTRETVRQAILDLGVRVPLETRHHGWTRSRNNWGQVCHAGMVAGALAVAEHDADAAVRTVQRALENVTVSMAMYDPKGSYPEGPGYWSYGTTYNVLLIAMLESVLGSSFGLDLAPGFDQTGQYMALTTGPSGSTFNYADGGSGRSCEPAVHWFATRHQRPDWLLGDEGPRQRVLAARPDGQASGNRFLPLLLLWMQEPETEVTPTMPLHWTSDCKVPIALHRSSWEDPQAVFVGIKAGSPSGPHGHMDIGSFVLDADGARWAVDLGAEGYHRIESRGMNFWSMAQNSDRWRVFRQNNFSHNTLVIDEGLQVVSGNSKIVRFSDDPDFPHSVVDLGPVYKDQVDQAHRGIALLPGGQVLVRDRLTGLKPGASVRWGMVTPGKPAEPGTSTLQLQQRDATLTMHIVSPADTIWQLIDTAEPRNEWDSPNRGTVMTAFHAIAPDSGVLDLTVVMTPGSRDPLAQGQIPTASPLDWGK